MDRLALKNIFTRMLAHRDEQTPPTGQQTKDAAVLIVDDSRTIVRALQLMLEREGYLTFSAADGVQAIAMAKRQRPDVVLMDVVMPNMNGFEATRSLVNDPETATIPVIMMSGTEQVSARGAIREGAPIALRFHVRRAAPVANILLLTGNGFLRPVPTAGPSDLTIRQ